MTGPPGPTFAVIVPTYNEADDIGATCESLLRLAPAPDEIIFVDGASTDGTPDIIRQHLTRPSVRLIVEGARRGPATARNVGVEAARSDVVVFADADVYLPPDFLARIARHYEQGADSVAVEMEVANRDNVYGRYTQALHEYLYRGDESLTFSQAFSCRRAVALAAGLFPEGLPGAEDFEFGRRLATQTTRRVVDRSIVVRHLVPGTLAGFWRQWEWRGAAFPMLRHWVHHVRRPVLIAERAATAGVSLLLLLTVVAPLRQAMTLSTRTGRRWTDLPAFLALSVVQQLASRTGECKGLARLYTLPRPSNAR